MKIFFSHASRDKSLVREIRGHLPDHLSSWIDERELLIGADLSSSIAEAVEDQVDYVVILLSLFSINSKWVKRELEWALVRESELGRTFVLPILLDDVWQDVEPPEFQKRLYLRCFDQSEAQVVAVAEGLYTQIVKLVFERIEEISRLETSLRSIIESLSDLLQQMSNDEKWLVHKISQQPGKGLKLMSSFSRDSQYHEVLRMLRERNLIQPAERGPWKSGKHARMTEIGRALVRSEYFANSMNSDEAPTWWNRSYERSRNI